MRTVRILALAATLGVGFVFSSYAQSEMFIYPSQGQSSEKESQDKWQCHEWAVKQTGVNPTQVAQAATNVNTYRMPEGGVRRGLFRGGAGGAALGAVGGAIAGDAGKGAAIGGAVGALGGIFRARTQVREQHTYNEAVAQQHRGALKSYDQAYATCLRGRGYTVSQ